MSFVFYFFKIILIELYNKEEINIDLQKITITVTIVTTYKQIESKSVSSRLSTQEAPKRKEKMKGKISNTTYKKNQFSFLKINHIFIQQIKKIEEN